MTSEVARREHLGPFAPTKHGAMGGNTVNNFQATHIIFSADEHIPVRFDDGAFYTSAEWLGLAPASWELTAEGLRFQGEIRDGYGYRRVE